MNEGQSMLFDEQAYSMMKLNLPSSAGHDDEESKLHRRENVTPDPIITKKKRQSDGQLSSEADDKISPEPRLTKSGSPSVLEEIVSKEENVASSVLGGSNLASIASYDKPRDTTPDASSQVNITRMATITLGQDPN